MTSVKVLHPFRSRKHEIRDSKKQVTQFLGHRQANTLINVFAPSQDTDVDLMRMSKEGGEMRVRKDVDQMIFLLITWLHLHQEPIDVQSRTQNEGRWNYRNRQRTDFRNLAVTALPDQVAAGQSWQCNDLKWSKAIKPDRAIVISLMYIMQTFFTVHIGTSVIKVVHLQARKAI